MSDMVSQSIWILSVMFVGSFFLYIMVSGLNVRTWINQKLYYGLIVLCFIFYLTLSGLMKYEVGDVMLFAGAGHYLRQGIDFYWIDANHTQYPFFPFLIFYHALANWVQETISLFTFSFYLKLLLTLSLLAITRLINLRHKKPNQRKQVLLFLTNPVVVLVTYFHGQVDLVLLAFLVWGLYLFFRSDLKNHRASWLSPVLASIFFSLSIAVKTWSVIILPWLIVKLKIQHKLILISTIIFVLLSDVFIYTRLVFGSGIRVVLPAVLKPGGPMGVWGISLFFSSWPELISRYNLLIFGIIFAFLYLLIVRKKTDIFTASGYIILAAYVALINWGVQYLIWLMPFLYLSQKFKTSIKLPFLVFSSIYVYVSYLNIVTAGTIIGPQWLKFFGLIIWSICLIWLISWLKTKDQSVNT